MDEYQRRLTVTRRSDPWSWTTVRVPESDLAQTILALAAPLLAKLGDAPAIDDERGVLGLTISFWNSSVLASKRWERPRLKAARDRLAGGLEPANEEAFCARRAAAYLPRLPSAHRRGAHSAGSAPS